MEEEKKVSEEYDVLFSFLAEWAELYEYEVILPSDDEKNIDFININFQTKKLYADELNINEPLTEVG